MRCKCGYLYSKVAPPWRNRSVEAYAVINYRSYRTFLKSEMQACACRDANSKLHALAHSSAYVGLLLRCPRCSRLLLLRPNRPRCGPESAFYVHDRSRRGKVVKQRSMKAKGSVAENETHSTRKHD